MTQHPSPFPPVLNISCRSSLDEIRAALVHVDAYLRAKDTPVDWIEDINIILAELLSNIARHGYSHDHGIIDLEIRLSDEELRCRVLDMGQPFDPEIAGHIPPEPGLLREGGYGWFLIRSLARALTYRRITDMNCLTFWVPVGRNHELAILVD